VGSQRLTASAMARPILSGWWLLKISRKPCWILAILNPIIKPLSDLKKMVGYIFSLGFWTKFLNPFYISPKHFAPSKRIRIGFDLRQFNPFRVPATYFLQNNDSTLQPCLPDNIPS
jgi:hypothetical protein